MPNIDFETRFRQIVKRLRELGEKKAEAKAISWQLQEMRKVILAQQMQGMDGSISEREHKARTSDAYLTHLKGTAEAIKEEHKYAAEWEAAWATYESLRSLCSQETAQTKII